MCKKFIYFASIIMILSMVNTSRAELAAYYSMDEGSGDTVADGTENGHDGTISNGTPTWVEGAPDSGTGLQFGTQGSGPVNCGEWDTTAGT